MVCFQHPDRSAAGICKHCQHGLCVECAAVAGDVLACRDRHEQHVDAANQVMARMLIQVQRLGAGCARNGLFYGLVGGVFVALGWSEYRFLGLQALFFILVGALLLFAALANSLEARKYR